MAEARGALEAQKSMGHQRQEQTLLTKTTLSAKRGHGAAAYRHPNGQPKNIITKETRFKQTKEA